MQVGFFTSRIGPNNLMNLLENSIVFHIGAAWVLFNSYYKQKQRPGALLKISAIPSMEEFCLDIQKNIIILK